MVGDLWRIALVALALNLILLVLFMRALVAPLYLLAASVLGYAAGLGLTVLLFQGVLGYDGLTYYVPLATAVLLVSLGSDYNVFVAGRIWAEARTRRLREAVAVATPQAAGAVTVAGHHARGQLRAARPRAAAVVPRVRAADGRRRADRHAARALPAHPRAGLDLRRVELVARPARRRRRATASSSPPSRAHRGSDDAAAADRAMRATLATLAERITRREAKALCTQLPGAYRGDLRSARGPPGAFGAEEFVARVGEREGAAEVQALDDARAVLATLAEMVDETTMEAIRAQLGEDAAPLMDETRGAAASSARPALPDVTPPAR